MNYLYTMVIQWSTEDNLCLVHLPEFPCQYFVTHGKTYEEAAQRGQEVLATLVEWYYDQGKPLPVPNSIAEKPSPVA